MSNKHRLRRKRPSNRALTRIRAVMTLTMEGRGYKVRWMLRTEQATRLLRAGITSAEIALLTREGILPRGDLEEIRESLKWREDQILGAEVVKESKAAQEGRDIFAETYDSVVRAASRSRMRRP
jgi:hypothetical protein